MKFFFFKKKTFRRMRPKLLDSKKNSFIILTEISKALNFSTKISKKLQILLLLIDQNEANKLQEKG
jgi:hypothetical protein